MNTEQLVEQFGEEYRRLIEDVLPWLDIQEPIWDLDEPINREDFIADLVERATPIIPKD